MRFKEAIGGFSNWRQFKVKKQTVKGYDRELRSFCLFLRNPEIEDITINNVMEYLNGMTELGWDQNSFVVKCSALKKFFEFYRLQGYRVLSEELIPMPRQEYKFPRIADDNGYQKLMTAIPRETNDPRHIRNRSILSMLWDTGARNGELLSLNVSDLEMEHEPPRAIIRTEKSRGIKPIRAIFWTADTNDHLLAWIKKREALKKKMKFGDQDALFISICGGQYNTSGQRLTIKGVGEMLRRYCNRAEIPNINAHSLRHHFGIEMAKKVSPWALADLMGHAHIQSTRHYTVMSAQGIAEEYQKGRIQWRG